MLIENNGYSAKLNDDIFGAGRFYIGEYIGASFKLILFILIYCITGPVIFCGFGINALVNMLRPGESAMAINPSTIVQASIGACCCCICFIFLTIWWIIDIILFGINEIPDGNGYTLNPSF